MHRGSVYADRDCREVERGARALQNSDDRRAFDPALDQIVAPPLQLDRGEHAHRLVEQARVTLQMVTHMRGVAGMAVAGGEVRG